MVKKSLAVRRHAENYSRLRFCLGLIDLFEDDESITLIEWAERLKDFEPNKGYKVKIKYLGEDKREIDISKI